MMPNKMKTSQITLFLLVIAYTGMRCGEACGLQWKNINFKEHTITIERSRDYGAPISLKH